MFFSKIGKLGQGDENDLPRGSGAAPKMGKEAVQGTGDGFPTR